MYAYFFTIWNKIINILTKLFSWGSRSDIELLRDKTHLGYQIPGEEEGNNVDPNSGLGRRSRGL